MLTFTGRCSVFGGKYDSGMSDSEGLSLYESKEADLRPDLFDNAPLNDPNQATWKRLRLTSFYCAYRFDHEGRRWRNQETPVKITNPKTAKWVMAWLVDWGPDVDTGRVLDVSPAVAAVLDLDTDDEIVVEIEI